MLTATAVSNSPGRDELLRMGRRLQRRSSLAKSEIEVHKQKKIGSPIDLLTDVTAWLKTEESFRTCMELFVTTF